MSLAIIFKTIIHPCQRPNPLEKAKKSMRTEPPSWLSHWSDYFQDHSGVDCWFIWIRLVWWRFGWYPAFFPCLMDEATATTFHSTRGRRRYFRQFGCFFYWLRYDVCCWTRIKDGFEMIFLVLSSEMNVKTKMRNFPGWFIEFWCAAVSYSY